MGAQAQGAASGRWATIPRTLVFLKNGDSVLLMQRSLTARIFLGRYNGIGGHIERDEDVLQAALREIEEECGLRAAQIAQLRLRGVLQVDAKQPIGVMVFIFSGEALTRDVQACSEGALAWIPLTAVADLPLVEDVPEFLARLFGDQASVGLFYGHSYYNDADQLVLTFADSAADSAQ